MGGSPGANRLEGRLGSLLVGVHDDEARLRYSGRVGSGISEATREQLEDLLAAPGAAEPPFTDPPRVREARWVAAPSSSSRSGSPSGPRPGCCASRAYSTGPAATTRGRHQTVVSGDDRFVDSVRARFARRRRPPHPAPRPRAPSRLRRRRAHRRPASRSSSATPRCCATARRCRPATGWSDPDVSPRGGAARVGGRRAGRRGRGRRRRAARRARGVRGRA